MNLAVEPSALATLPLFDGLRDDELAQLAANLHRSVVPAGTRVISAQQPGEAVYLILSGSVKIQMLKEDGTEITLALLGPGDTVGEMSLLDSAARSADVVTLEETTFLWMDRGSFLQQLDAFSQLTRNLVRQLSNRLRAANQQIQALSTLDVAGRVAQQILAFAEQYGSSFHDGTRIPLPLTQSDIAEMVGATRERVNHVIVALKRRKVISVDPRHRITVHRSEALLELCR